MRSGTRIVFVGGWLLAGCFGDPAPARPSTNATVAPSSTPPKRSEIDEARDLSEFNDPWLALHPAEVKMLEYARAMCACRDRGCADALQGDMNGWSEKNRVIAEEGRKTSGRTAEEDLPPPEMYARMKRIGAKYGACMAAALGTN